MVLEASIKPECIISQPSRLVYTIHPTFLVYIGPNIDKAITDLIDALITAFKDKGFHVRHIATTYSLANISILLDCTESGEEIHANLVRLVRLCFRNGSISGTEVTNKCFSQRVIDQLQNIQRSYRALDFPFSCVEDWQGFGPKDHPIYERMVEASCSIEDWRAFKDTVCVPLTIILLFANRSKFARSQYSPGEESYKHGERQGTSAHHPNG